MEALRRLWEIANGHSGQCRVVARFLLGLYNGEEYEWRMDDGQQLHPERSGVDPALTQPK